MGKKTSNVKRIRRVKHKGRALLAVLIILGVITCVALSLTVFFPITEFTVTGNVTSYYDEGIINASGIKMGDNLFAFSSSSVQRKISEAFPYIESVKVKRSLSGRITLECTEAYDFLSLPLNDGTYLVLSPNLKIVEIATSNQKGFAEIYGLNPSAAKTGGKLSSASENGTTYLEYVVNAANEYGMLDKLSAVDVADKLNLSLVYDNRFYVMIGTANQIDYKMKMLNQIVTENIADTESGYIDVSVPGKATYNVGALTLPEGYGVPAKIETKPEPAEENK